MKKTIFIVLALFMAWHGTQAQDISSVLEKMKPKTDSIKKEVPYDKIVNKKAIVKKGLMNLVESEGKYYLEIPAAMMNREILVVNRIAEGAAGLEKVYAGDQINEAVISLSFGKDRKNINVSIRDYTLKELKPGEEMYENLKRSNRQPVNYTWPVKTTAPDSAKVVEITQLLQTDETLFGFHPKAKKEMGIGSVKSGSGLVDRVEAFPNNLAMYVQRSYGQGANPMASMLGMPTTGANDNDATYTLKLSSSWILLPEKPMRIREYDERVGYFYNHMIDFGANPHGVKAIGLATRWRLEPKPADVKRYLAGELVEPAKPIVFYIDPTTPEKWIPYLIKGVNDWQRAFEKAGFKNAIMARRAPTPAEDPSWSLDDARYSAIVYKPSDIPNASGPHVGDPRTGEILESHINWYHNVMLILETWYTAQVAAVDPRARKYQIDDELMGELIRFVSSHEVGHTLGLRHNFLASNATPVEKLRDRAWVEKNGHTASIMDYARFNYVAQPEDRIGPAGLYPRVNDYDEWAISWGYRWYGNLDEAEEKQALAKLTTEAIKNPRLRWGATRELPGTPDPRAQTEDLGDNQMKANTYGLKNLQYVAAHLPEWKIKKGEDYDKLMSSFQYGLLNQYVNYMGHALTYLGGVYGDNHGANDGAPNNFSPAPIALQKEALDFLDQWALHRQDWLMDENILGKLINPATPRAVNLDEKLGERWVSNLVGPDQLKKMAAMNSRFGEKSYPLADYLNDVQQKIWAELDHGGKIGHYRQAIQNNYLAELAKLIKPKEKSNDGGGMMAMMMSAMGGGADTNNPAKALAVASVEQLREKIASALQSGKFTDVSTQAQLKLALRQIDQMLSIN